MARIETYVEDNQVTANDIVIGTDGDDFNKTKNFRVSALASFVETLVQNNIPNIVTTFVGQSDSIADILPSINLSVSVMQTPTILIFIKDQLTTATPASLGGATTDVVTSVKYTYLFPLGAGEYNPISNFITFDDLVLLNVDSPVQADISNQPNTQIIDLGDITGSDFISEINAQNPSFDLQDNTQSFFFSYEDGGVLFLQKFIGANGIYGLNDSQVDASDFISFSDNNIDDDNVKAKYVRVKLNNNAYPNEASEITSFVSAFNNLPAFVVSEKELIVGYSDSLINDAGNPYRSVYIVNTGKGIYGLNFSQIVSDNVLKIRGERINKNLSSFNNDSNFVSQSDLSNELDQKVSKSGDTMTGDLSMGGNKVTSTAEPTADEDLTNKAYVDSLNRYRGDYTDSASIIGLPNNTDGDYATLTAGEIKQLWVFANFSWRLQSAKPFVSSVSSSFTLSNNFHNATIDVVAGNITIDLPDNLIDGLEFNIRNYSGGNVTFNTTGTATSSETELFTGNLATCILDGNNYIIDKTGGVVGENIRIGLYAYEDTQAAQNLVANTYQVLSNNGLGSNTFKDPLPSIPELYNVVTDRFDFSSLNIGDVVKIRIDLDATTVASNNVLDCRMVLGEGQAGEYSLPFFSSSYFKNSGTYQIVDEIEIYIGNDLTKNNPAYIEIKSDGADTILNNGFYAKVINRN